MSTYQRSYSREDPRLNRQASNSSPKVAKAPIVPSSNVNSNNGQAVQAPNEGWNTQQANYNHSQALQNAYTSLPYHNTGGGHQYPTQTYYTGYQNYSYNPYENYQASQQAPYIPPGGEPRPPGEEYPHGGWTSSNNYPPGVVAEAPSVPPPAPREYNNSIENNDKKKTDAVAEEKIKQLASLMKERETYEDRVMSLKKKLRLLIAQKEDLTSKRSPDKENLRIIKENTMLQVEIQSKIKDATNVIDILSNLIGDKKKAVKTEDNSKSSSKSSCKDEMPSLKGHEKINYKHFDPEIHWCRLCDVFPQSAKELLLHLHSKGHQSQAATQEEIPWHKLPPEPKFPTHEGAPVKRVPIKGLQFFVASTAWYCRLCDVWIGDLHCASQHLMSVSHSQNYSNFVEQNPHWEAEWMKDREKAHDRLKRSKGDSDTDARKRRDKHSPSTVHEGKKKKRSKRRKKHSSDESSSSSSSSSSSEEEDKSKSIRVAMRNKLLESEGKLDILGKLVRQGKKDELPEDKLLTQWMTSANEPVGKDKQILDNLKEKLKQKQDAEKAKIAYEAELIRRQKEREEADLREREQLEKEALAKEDEKKHREKMSLKLKQPTIRESYRREQRRSNSRSPDKRRRRSRSASPPRRGYRNGRDYEERSPRYERRRSRSRSHERSRDRRRSRSKSHDRRDRDQDDDQKDKFKAQSNKKLPFIGRMPLFKNVKPKSNNDEPKREVKKEDYEPPRKTRFQPGTLARSFIPEPEVVCFPQLSSIPPTPPPPPPITPAAKHPPEPPKISAPKPPPPPKLEVPVEEAPKLEPKAERALLEAAREEAFDDDADNDEAETEMELASQSVANHQDSGMGYAHSQMGVQPQQADHTASEDYMLYEDPTNTMYQYGTMDYSMMYPSAPAYNFMPVSAMDPPGVEAEPPKSHTLPLEPPPLPPDDPNDDLAMLGLSSDDMAVQQMY